MTYGMKEEKFNQALKQFLAGVKLDMIQYVREHPEINPVELGTMIPEFMQARLDRQYEIGQAILENSTKAKKMRKELSDTIYKEIRSGS